MFVHLHWHSHYSLLEAIGTPKAIIAKAKELEMEAIALTDYSGMYGIVEFYEEAKKQWIKPLLWVELGLVHDISVKEKNEHAGTIVLLTTSYQGYQQLLQLVSHANLEGYHHKARTDFALLKKYAVDCIALVGGPNSVLWTLVLQEESDKKIAETRTMLQDIVGKENCYIELLAQDEKKLKEVHRVNTTLLKLADETDSPVVVTSNFHYVHKDDKKAFEVALAIKDGKRIYDEGKRTFEGNGHILSEDEVRKTLKGNGYTEQQITNRIEATADVSARCTTDIPLGKILFPTYESPEEIVTLYEKVKGELIIS